jgi:hypothetical protein
VKKKILYVDEVYSQSQELIEKNIRNLNYTQSIKKIHSLKISWSDLFKINFKDINFIYIYPNIIDLQKKWCYENNIKFSDEITTFIKQASIENPDLIFFQSTAILKKILKKNKLEYKYFFWDGTSQNNKLLARNATGVMTNMNSSNQFYKNLGLKSLKINHFFDNRIKFPKLKKKYFISFIGSIANKNHFDRCLFLYKISKVQKVNFFIGDQVNFFRLIGIIFYNLIFKKKKIKELILYFFAYKYILSNNKGAIFGNDMYKKIYQSKILLNYHLNTEDGLNMRVFEVTGLGVCLLTDYRPALELYFKFNKEIFVYQNADEAITIINDLKKNQKKINVISKCAQQKTLSAYVFKNSKKRILNFIKKLF